MDQKAMKRRESGASQVDDETLLALAAAGKSSRQIEQALGNIDHATVCRRLKHLTPRQSTEIFKSYKADILAESQRKLMMMSDKPGVNARDRRDYAVTLGILMDQERKERGQHEDKTRPMVMIFERSNVQINSGAGPLPAGNDGPAGDVNSSRPVINSVLTAHTAKSNDIR
jgi:hypothetical protein